MKQREHRRLLAKHDFITLLSILFVLGLWAKPSVAQPKEHSSIPSDTSQHSLNVKFQDMKWGKMFPEFGEDSPEITILHVDPKTGATQLIIKVPKNFHVPRHWHTANETHTVLSGSFIMECEGKRDTLGTGSFNFIPGKMVHQAWTKPNENAVLFITVDQAWDINWVDGPPQPPKKQQAK